MSDAYSTGDYQSISDMSQPASWNRFHVLVAGNTNGAHEALLRKIKASGHTEVDSFEESDYCLAFCPIISRFGTDVGSALGHIPADKPTVLVVMYHTFRGDYVVPDSGRLVENLNVRLTVDCLFHERELLKCRRNEIAWSDIQKFLGFAQVPDATGIWNYIVKNRKKLCVYVAGAVVLVVIVTVIVTQVNKH